MDNYKSMFSIDKRGSYTMSDDLLKNSLQLKTFCQAFEKNDTAVIEELFNAYLKKTISIRDTGVQKDMFEERESGIVIELKYAENAAFDAACKEALPQITGKHYEEMLVNNGMETIYRYGIACYKKRCKAVSA